MLTCAALALGLHIGTVHDQTGPALRDFNPGAYAVCDDIVAGAYRNSQGRGSVYAARVYRLGPADVALGAVTGYQLAPVLPLIVPSVRLGHVRASLLLPFEKGAAGIHFSWEF